MKVSSFSEITKTKPEKRLVKTKKKTGGRNSYGRITARGIGGGHKQKIRNVDFKRNKHGMAAEVIAIEYDPCRSARLALLQYEDGEKRYMIAVDGIEVGSKVMRGPEATVENAGEAALGGNSEVKRKVFCHDGFGGQRRSRKDRHRQGGPDAQQGQAADHARRGEEPGGSSNGRWRRPHLGRWAPDVAMGSPGQGLQDAAQV